MRAALVIPIAITACSGPARQAPPPADPVTGALPDPDKLPMEVAPPAEDAGAAPVEPLPAMDAGAAPAAASAITAAKVSWPSDRRPAQLHLLGGGVPHTTAIAVSSDGSTPIGYAHVKAGLEHAVRWRDGVLTPLAPPSSLVGLPTWALATSRNGDVVAGLAISRDGQTSTALTWNKSGAATPLATPDGLNGARATGVSRDGSVITGCAGSCTSLVTWRGARWDTRPAPEKFEAGSNALSENGAMLAGTIDEYGETPEAARLTSDKVEKLGPKTRVDGISDDGAVLVGSANGRAALWRGKKLTDLGVLAGYETCHATAISADGGRVVGTCRRENGEPAAPGRERATGVALDRKASVAFIWDKKHGIRTVQHALATEHKVSLPAELWLDEANDICGYGLTIVGSAQSKTSGHEAYLAIVPR